jgi:hypothetical protein
MAHTGTWEQRPPQARRDQAYAIASWAVVNEPRRRSLEVLARQVTSIQDLPPSSRYDSQTGETRCVEQRTA